MRPQRSPDARALRPSDQDRPAADRPLQVNAEQRLDGKYLLSTSDSDLSAEDVALGYKNLLEAEPGFRDLKTTIELRPVFHRLEHRIRAHILLSWLALLLIRIAERQTGQTWRRVALDLQRLHLVTLTGPTGTLQQTTRLTDAQRQILTVTGVDTPPRITALSPLEAPLSSPPRPLPAQPRAWHTRTSCTKSQHAGTAGDIGRSV